MNRQARSVSGGVLRGLIFVTLFLAAAVSVAAATKLTGKANLPAAALGPYAVDPEPMTLAECGRCHQHHFETLKNEGGAHRFDCRECHEVFHAYNPRKNNYAELMPVCGNCHGQPHGAKQLDCLACHENPHAPITQFSLQVLAKSCAECHQQPAQQLKQSPSAHSDQACQDCHSQHHGRIPSCFECHTAHFPDQPLDACLACHPAHKPLETVFAAESAAATCAACHKEAFVKWANTPSRHGQVNCTACHTKHGSLPACTDCHQAPHPPQMTARFNDCLICHVDPHDLPIKAK